MRVTFLDVNNIEKTNEKKYNLFLGNINTKTYTNHINMIDKEKVNIFTCKYTCDEKITYQHFFSENDFPIVYYIYVPNFISIQYEHIINISNDDIPIQSYYYLLFNMIYDDVNIKYIKLEKEPYIIILNTKNISMFLFDDYKNSKNNSPIVRFYPDTHRIDDLVDYEIKIENNVLYDNTLYLESWRHMLKNDMYIILDWDYLIPRIIHNHDNQVKIKKMIDLYNNNKKGFTTFINIKNDVCLYTFLEYIGVKNVYTSNYRYNVLMQRYYKMKIYDLHDIETPKTIISPFVFNKYETLEPHDSDYSGKVILITQYFILNYDNPSYNTKRQAEFNSCIMNNVLNTNIDEIHLLLERPVSFDFLDDTQQQKIKQIIIHKRMTYFDAFDYYNKFIPNSIAILCNNDICASKKNLNLLKEFPDYIYDNTFYCLTRYENQNNHRPLYLNTAFIGAESCCQDIWIWKSSHIKTDNTKFYLGILGCDNYIPVIMKNNGYTIHNVSKVFLFEHIDNISQRDFKKKLSSNRETRIGSLKWYMFTPIVNYIPNYTIYNNIMTYDNNSKGHIYNFKNTQNHVMILYVSSSLHKKMNNICANPKKLSVFTQSNNNTTYELSSTASFEYHRSQDFMNVVFLDLKNVLSIKIVVDEWFQREIQRLNFNDIIECVVGYM